VIRRLLLLSAPLWAALAAITLYGWLAIPEGVQVPVHWNASGVADRYGGKAEGLTIVPVVALVRAAIFAMPLMLGPGGSRGRSGANIRSSPLPLLVGFLGLLALNVVGQGVIVLAATGAIETDGGPVRIILLALSALLVVLGNVLPKARPNWFVGLRTPWSFASERSWDKSQRLGGWLLTLAGIAGIVGAIALPPKGALIVLMSAILAAADPADRHVLRVVEAGPGPAGRRRGRLTAGRSDRSPQLIWKRRRTARAARKTRMMARSDSKLPRRRAASATPGP
jgi:uncharacterized membrane protein